MLAWGKGVEGLRGVKVAFWQEDAERRAIAWSGKCRDGVEVKSESRDLSTRSGDVTLRQKADDKGMHQRGGNAKLVVIVEAFHVEEMAPD